MIQSTRQNAVLVPILILFGINMVLCAVNITHWMAEDNFRTFSEDSKTDLVEQLRPRVNAVMADLPDGATPRQIGQALDIHVLSGTVAAYEILNESGEAIIFRSRGSPRAWLSNDGLVRGRDDFLRHGGDRSYSRAEFALSGDQLTDGRIGIYIDQSNALALFYATHRNITVVSILFLVTGLSLMIYVVWSRVREQWRADDRIRHLANYDDLTNLPKRAVFLNKLTDGVNRLGVDGTVVGLLCLDIDNFKQINDSMGHATGDELLRQFADRLRANTRETDLLCRLGGDEFSVALRGLNSPDSIPTLSNRLREQLAVPYVIDGREIATTVSIGVSVAPTDTTDAATMLKSADLALYRCKSEGRNTVRFFEKQMDVAFQQRIQLGQELKTAVSKDQFILHYQPQLDLRTGDVTGREALVRWDHPIRGLTAPNTFIPAAEETGLIIPLSRWILEQACRDAQESGWSGTLAINMSPLQFTADNVIDLVSETLQKTGFPAERLELEITETLLMSNAGRVSEDISRLHEMGVKIVLDDFGTGYSNLSYLASLPFDKLKIDRSFIADMSINPTADVIVRTIIRMGHELKMTIVAEGIETRQQEILLRGWGCDQVQGFLYGRPDCANQDTAELSDVGTVVYPAFSSPG